MTQFTESSLLLGLNTSLAGTVGFVHRNTPEKVYREDRREMRVCGREGGKE